MVVKTLLKRGIKKLTKKKPKTKPKTKPTPRYRTDPKTGQKFLNRRVKGAPKAGAYDRKMSVPKGVRAPKGVRSGLKKESTSLFGKTKRDKIASLIAAGALVTPPTLMGLAASRSKKKQEKDKLKKAADEHIKKGKKKQYKDRGGKGNK